MVNQKNTYKRLNKSEMTPLMVAEYHRLQHELQCQEALLVLMQKLRTNQRFVSQTNSNNNNNSNDNNNNNNNNNNSVKQRTAIPMTATKLNQQSPAADGKSSILATKQTQQVIFCREKVVLLFFFMFLFRITQIDRHQRKYLIQINIL